MKFVCGEGALKILSLSLSLHLRRGGLSVGVCLVSVGLHVAVQFYVFCAGVGGDLDQNLASQAFKTDQRDIHGPKPYKSIGFGDIHGPKPFKR